jgi:uncharacterized glyoxalase superfamily protein PhnB
MQPLIYLHIRNASAAIAFYEAAFGARELYRLTEPGGTRVGHAELDLGGNKIMLADEYPELGVTGPESLGGTSVTIHLMVDNADAAIDRAVKAGATLERPAKDEFYGDRTGAIRDPFGHRWILCHHLADVSPAEMQRRWDEMAAK